ncbi:MAG: VOC family protein [Candidatus Bathyarchaeia archaeon]
MTASLDHIGIYVEDLERSLRFYAELFGFPEHRRFTAGESRIAVLDVGGGLLELIQRPGAPGEAPKGRWSHIAFHIDAFDAVLERAEGMGLLQRKVTLDDGSRIAFLRDPDGHDIEIMERGLGQ